MAARRGLLVVGACALFGAFALPAGRADADAAGPLRITLVGSGSVRARAAIGSFMPCDAKENQPLWSGVMQPGTIEIATDAACVCVQQTFAPLIDVGWTVGNIGCRPHGRNWRWIDFSKPITMTLTSREP
jgi:hypothetical protein